MYHSYNLSDDMTYASEVKRSRNAIEKVIYAM